MKYLILVFILFCSISLFCQKIYFGYPSNNNNLNEGDIIIISRLPISHGHIIATEFNYFDKLKSFMLINSKFKFEIRLFYFTSNEYGAKITDYYSKKLIEVFNSDKSFSKNVIYEIIPFDGKSNIIPLEIIENKKDSIERAILKCLNSRVEIRLKYKGKYN